MVVVDRSTDAESKDAVRIEKKTEIDLVAIVFIVQQSIPVYVGPDGVRGTVFRHVI